MRSQCLISFGSNLGERTAAIADAARIIATSSLVDRFQASRLFETPPIGGPEGQDPFVNAVAAFETEASARQILDLLQSTEQHLGRTREVRWDARSIDLDVVLHGELVGGGTGLIVPHPRYTARQFVLQPACDVAAQYRDPRFGWTLQQLADHLNEGLPSIALVGGDVQIRTEILAGLGEPASQMEMIPKTIGRPWVSGYLPNLPDLTSETTKSNDIPRLIARIQRTTPQTRWPAPHQLWPASWQWPEYRLEVDDVEWAIREVAAALHSMRCPVAPISKDGDWWT